MTSAIVRELVTRLSFTFDRTNLNKFEKAISGFQTQFNTARLAISSTLGKLFDFTSEFAESATQTKLIADYSGIAVDNFKSLQLAVSEFGIDESSVNDLFQKITEGLQDAKIGTGLIYDLAQKTQGVLDFRGKTGNKTTLQFFLDIAKALKDIKGTENQLKALQQSGLFKFEDLSRWLELLKDGDQEILKLISRQKQAGEDFAASLGGTKKFQKEVAELSTEFKKFALSIGEFLVPIINDITKGFNLFFSSVSQAGGGLTGFASGFAQSVGKIARGIITETTGFDFSRFDQAKNSNNNSNTIQNNTINVNLDSVASTDGQATHIGELIGESIERVLQEQYRTVLNNSPQVE